MVKVVTLPNLPNHRVSCFHIAYSKLRASLTGALCATRALRDEFCARYGASLTGSKPTAKQPNPMSDTGWRKYKNSYKVERHDPESRRLSSKTERAVYHSVSDCPGRLRTSNSAKCETIYSTSGKLVDTKGHQNRRIQAMDPPSRRILAETAYHDPDMAEQVMAWRRPRHSDDA